MSKGRYKRITERSSINWNNCDIYKINKNKSIIFRCRFCHQSRLKKEKKQIIKLSGHKHNCTVICKNICFKNKNSENLLSSFETTYNTLENSLKSNDNLINDKSYIMEKIYKNKKENIDNNKNKRKIFTEQPVKDKKKLFKLLINIFDKRDNLNCLQELMGIYYINRNKIIGEGAFSHVFLGEDKYQKMNVAILQMNIEREDKFNIETFALSKIHGKGNFPQLYHTYVDDNYYYLVENLMGPNLKLLHKICDKKFDYYTVINISIDLLKHIEILHGLGFVHRDLKPDNLVFGNLCYENSNMKNEIGIIDFSNCKINIKSNGEIKFCNNKVECQGNRCFSSTNALKDKDVNYKDDLISIFYILIYFMKGELPWSKKNLMGKSFSKKEIIKIRENTTLKQLCANIPKDFEQLIGKVFRMKENENIDYNYIKNNLEKIKRKEEKRQINKPEKFCWISLLKKYLEKSKEIYPGTNELIKKMIERYNIKLKDYLEYLKY